MAETNQIKSKARVRERGEVFTSEREVNAMLDLVKEETERIESRFLEPACGTGNFLAEVLHRKLSACKRYEKSPLEWERNSFFAVSSIYGIDIMEDNVRQCRERLFGIWTDEASRTGCADSRVTEAVKYLLERNILLGNALSLKMVDSDGNDTDAPIIFSEWSWGGLPNKIQRRDYRLDVLLENGEKESPGELTFDFFGDSASNSCNWMVDPDDPEGKHLIPAPTKEWTLIDYWRIADGV